MRTLTVTFALCFAALAWGGGNRGGNPIQCEQKCDASTKVCEQQCTDRFPKDKQNACKKACVGSGPTCQAHCRGEK